MQGKRQIELFSAGCSICEEAIQTVQAVACDSCDVTVHDISHPEAGARAKELGVRSVPAVAVNGKLADCCSGNGIDEQTLRQAGLGQPH